MERRDHRRFPRRVEVRFWRHGDATSHSAFTTNLSKTGMFLGSASALTPGERLRLEIVEPSHGFVVEGRVARVHRVSVALRHVDQPGFGVRFVPPDELIEDFLPPAARQSGPARLTREGPEYTDAQEAAPGSVPRIAEGVDETGSPELRSPSFKPPSALWVTETPEPPVAPPVAPAVAAPAKSAAPSPGTPPPAAAAPASLPPARRTDAPSPGGGTRLKIIPVVFDDPSSFLSVFHRDIQSGGLFVSTPEPARLNQVVWIELQLPLPDVRPELIAARVVQRFEPDAAVGSGRNVLAGMALQFLDPERVIAELRPLLARLRR